MSSLAASTTGAAPALRTGDHMSPGEFDRIYEHLHDVRAELIDGVVYVASPVRTRSHGESHAHLIMAIGAFLERNPQIKISDNGTLLLPGGSRVQPDISLFVEGSSAVLNAEGYMEGVPEFIAEIASSTFEFDAREKLRLYERSGVREYLLWQTDSGQIDLFVSNAGVFEAVSPAVNGILESRVFPGLRFGVAALLAGDRAAAAAAMRTKEL